MELAGVAVSDIGESGGTDQDQDSSKRKYTFHRRDSFRLGMLNYAINYSIKRNTAHSKVRSNQTIVLPAVMIFKISISFLFPVLHFEKSVVESLQT